MKLTLSRQIARSRGRITRYIKKSKDLRRAVLLIIASILVIPVIPVSAAQEVEKPIEGSVEINLSYGPALVTVQPQFGVDIQESRYRQKIAAARAARAKVIRVMPVINATGDEKWALASAAAAKYGIPTSLLMAVWQIESGQRMYFEGGSTVGARGPCQFMPGTWRAYQEDGNGDGVANIFDARDCLYGSAKLLARNGAASGDYRRALYAYNHSISYVNKVLAMAGL